MIISFPFLNNTKGISLCSGLNLTHGILFAAFIISSTILRKKIEQRNKAIQNNLFLFLFEFCLIRTLKNKINYTNLNAQIISFIFNCVASSHKLLA
jgi:hypothetical protein